METLKFWFYSILAVIVLGGLGYFAVTGLETGSEYVNSAQIKELERENKDLKQQILALEDELAIYKPREEEQVEEEIVVPEEEEIVETSTTNKYASLISELQKLVDDNIYMKLKSRGTRVGTVQNFLNVYNKTNNKVDNDYGEGTKTRVIAFQKSVGLTADGEAGPSTFKKMIEWLQKNG